MPGGGAIDYDRGRQNRDVGQIGGGERGGRVREVQAQEESQETRDDDQKSNQGDRTLRFKALEN